MEVRQPTVYFLTWTTYGSWLHGDERGSVHHRDAAPGTPRIAPDPRRQDLCRNLLQGDPVLLSDEMRSVVDAAIREHCRFAGWGMHALNVRTNHVHVVVESAPKSPETTMNSLKSWATRALRGRGLVRAEGRVGRAMEARDGFTQR